MRYTVEIGTVTTVSIVVDTGSKCEARELAKQLLQNTGEVPLETIGDPVTEAPHIRSIRKLGV